MAMGMKVNWGAALIGAGLVVGILAFSAAPAALALAPGTSMLTALAGQIGTWGAVGGTALAGAAIGHKTANLFHRGQDAATTLVGR